MEKSLFENELYQFTHNDQANALIFNWKDATKNMTYEDFKEACVNYAGFVIEYETTNLVVNTKAFHFELPEAYMEWKNENLNPRYKKVGVSKQAFVMKTEYYEQFKNEELQDDGYVNRYFDSEEQALHWLNEN